MTVPYNANNGEYWFSHAYYPACSMCGIGHGEIELKTIEDSHEWCEQHSKRYGCKFIRVEHVIHWEKEEEE